MAKDRGDMVQVPAADWERLQARLDALEHADRLRAERSDDFHAKQVLDARQEALEVELMRSPQDRTQARADREYGTEGPRWHCRLDSTREDGKPGPDIREWFGVVLCANSDLEAQARYLKIMGITKHDYRVVVEPLEAEALAPA